jgi:Ferritin-like domain
MIATTTGPNRTGTAQTPQRVDLMLEAVDEFSPPAPISTLRLDTERQTYISQADSVGSIPPPQKSKSARKSQSQMMGLLLDKLGERIAFERTGTRLYDALITKYLALTNSQDVRNATATVAAKTTAHPLDAEASLQVLRKIRSDELAHFHLLSGCVKALGGDPTAQTPCADVTATASLGLMQVITDPRTTLAQCLGAILTAELTDNAGWELLSELASNTGHPQLAAQFADALTTEAEHLQTIRTWLKSLLMNDVGSPAV